MAYTLKDVGFFVCFFTLSSEIVQQVSDALRDARFFHLPTVPTSGCGFPLIVPGWLLHLLHSKFQACTLAYRKVGAGKAKGRCIYYERV